MYLAAQELMCSCLWQGYYFAGDGARRDADGYIWITGRIDDVRPPSLSRLAWDLPASSSCSALLVVH